jgi:hypothetical protein
MNRNNKPLIFCLTVGAFRWSAQDREYRRIFGEGGLFEVVNLRQFRRLIAPCRAKKHLILTLERVLPTGIDFNKLHKLPLEDGAAVGVSFAADKAVVKYWSRLAGEHAPVELATHKEYEGPDKPLSFPEYFVQGGEVRVHPYWTVSRAEGIQALEYFARHGTRDPAFSWVEVYYPESVEQAEPDAAPDRGGNTASRRSSSPRRRGR